MAPTTDFASPVNSQSEKLYRKSGSQCHIRGLFFRQCPPSCFEIVPRLSRRKGPLTHPGTNVAQKVVDLCDEYIHRNLPRCTFLKRLAGYNWSNGRHQVAVFGCNITDEGV